MSETIFSKIIRKEIPADIVYEDDDVLAFKDIDPKAPVHILIIPKQFIPRVTGLKYPEHNDILGKLFKVANIVAEKSGLSEKGFRIIINTGDEAGQAVQHLHLHLIGGKKLGWTPA